MWQTSLLFLKPLQIQNLKRKKWGEHGILCPPIWKRGGTRVSHQVAPMLVFDFRLFTATRCRPCKKHPTLFQPPTLIAFTMLAALSLTIKWTECAISKSSKADLKPDTKLSAEWDCAKGKHSKTIDFLSQSFCLMKWTVHSLNFYVFSALAPGKNFSLPRPGTRSITSAREKPRG